MQANLVVECYAKVVRAARRAGRARAPQEELTAQTCAHNRDRSALGAALGRRSAPSLPIAEFRLNDRRTPGSRELLSLVSLLLFLSTTSPVLAKTAPIWSIGTPDGYSVEFAPGARDRLTYAVGQNIVSRDFAGNQNGSVGWDGKVVAKPYTISFDLGEPPQGRYELVLDLIFNTGAPRQFKVRVNDQTGIFPIRPAPMRSRWG